METEQQHAIEKEQQSSTMNRNIIVLTILVIICLIIMIIVAFSLSSNNDENDDGSSTTSCTITYNPRPNCTDHCTQQFSSYIESILSDSKSWDESTSTTYLQSFHSTELGECITNINTSKTCELRPDPSCYLPSNVINYHLDLFRLSGGSSITSTKWESYSNFSTIGYPPQPTGYDINGLQWISPYSVQTQIFNDCSLESNPEDCVLIALGIDINAWDMFHNDWGNPTVINRVMQVHIYVESLDDLDLRIPSGNEQGANDLWRPGGYTINGTAEAVVDQIFDEEYCWIAVSTPNGTYCYGHCEVVCADFGGCQETNCEFT